MQKEIKVNFTVAEKSDFGADTKAIKAGWEVGDQILLVFQGNDATYNGNWLGWANNNNTITLTKTAGGWESTPINLTLSDLQSGKNYRAIHHMGNITISNEYIDMASYKAYLTGYKGGEIMSCRAPYTVNGEALDLGTIKLERGIKLYGSTQTYGNFSNHSSPNDGKYFLRLYIRPKSSMKRFENR